MRALRFDKDTTKAVARLVELHLRFHGYGQGQWTDSAVRRYVTDAGGLLGRLHRLTRADCTTRNVRAGSSRPMTTWSADRPSLAAELGESPDLDGNDIAGLGIAPGRAELLSTLSVRLDEVENEVARGAARGRPAQSGSGGRGGSGTVTSAPWVHIVGGLWPQGLPSGPGGCAEGITVVSTMRSRLPHRGMLGWSRPPWCSAPSSPWRGPPTAPTCCW
jgi:hypothetical protein